MRFILRGNFTVIAIAVAFALTAAACGGDTPGTPTVPPTSIPAAPTTTAVTDTTTTAAPNAETGLVWSRVSHDEVTLGGAGDQAMLSVAVGGPGLVAVGYDNTGDDGSAAVWTSVDGLAWSRVAHDEVVVGGIHDQVMRSVVAGGPGLVAVGSDARGHDGSGAVWTSSDGLVWSRVAHDESVFGGADDQIMSSVVAGGPGLVAVGYDYSAGHWDGMVLNSSDGLVWSRVTGQPELGGAGDQVMRSITVGGAGVVAVGTDGRGQGGSGAVWNSPDGLVWSRVDHDEVALGGTGDQVMSSVIVGGPGFVAVGHDEGDASALAVWTSPDGATWTRLESAAFLGGSDGHVLASVVSGGPGFVAVGQAESSAVVWTSVDGSTWVRVLHDEAVFGGSDDQVLSAVVAGGPGFVAVGNDGLPDGGLSAAVWVSPPGP